MYPPEPPQRRAKPIATRNEILLVGVFIVVVMSLLVAGLWSYFNSDDKPRELTDQQIAAIPTPKEQPVSNADSDIPKSPFPNPEMPIGTKPSQSEDDLISASYLNDVAKVKALLSAGVNVNAQDQLGKSALSWACSLGHTQMVKLLLGNKADPNTKDNYGIPALTKAADQGHAEIVRLLLQAGAAVNTRQYITGETALDAAQFNGNKQVIAILKNAGARSYKTK